LADPLLLADLQFDGQELSALCDGETDEATLVRGLAAWQADAEVRRRWRDYHLVGEVLRSADLAQAVGSRQGDALWLDQLRTRLLTEAPPHAYAGATIAAGADIGLGGRTPHAPVETGASADATDATRPQNVLPLRAQPQPGSSLRQRQLWRRWSMPAGIAAGVALVGGLVVMTSSSQSPGQDGLAINNLPELTPVRQLPLDQAQATRIDGYLAAHQQFQQRMPASAQLRSVAFEVSPER
jgi:negative regulator of sigma E activity